MSHPSRVRGLKCDRHHRLIVCLFVAPFTGAWIEIESVVTDTIVPRSVAPFTGAWIEI